MVGITRSKVIFLICWMQVWKSGVKGAQCDHKDQYDIKGNLADIDVLHDLFDDVRICFMMHLVNEDKQHVFRLSWIW